VKAVAAKYSISEAIYYAWKRKYGGMEVSEAKKELGCWVATEQKSSIRRALARFRTLP